MDGTALMVVSILLFVAICGLTLTCVWLCAALSKTDDRRILAKSLQDIVNTIVLEKDDQIHRVRMESERELGLEHIRAQERALQAPRIRGDPVSNNGKDLRNSVHVDTEE